MDKQKPEHPAKKGDSHVDAKSVPGLNPAPKQAQREPRQEPHMRRPDRRMPLHDAGLD